MKAEDPSGIETPRPWFAGGLRFECQPDCAGCCTTHDQYAYVYIEDEDERRLARFLKLSLDEFRATHTVLDDGDRVLRMDHPDCPFLDAKRCTVYAARPVQCRTFPFWDENLSSRRRWEALAEFCPGIDRGARHPLHVIDEQRTARRR